MTDPRPLRIAIDCRIPEARQGHGAAIRLLAHSLSRLEDCGQEYTFLIREELRDWLEPYLSGPCCLAVVEAPSARWKRSVRALVSAAGLGTIAKRMPRSIPPPPVSDGYVERGDFDAVHFPTQQAYLTSLPTIYQPWDLQHVHYPQFFSARDLAIRDCWYRAFCKQASVVCVQAEWARQDLIASYAVPEKKLAVVPWGSTFDAYEAPAAEALEATRARFSLPQQFFFYPAVTWQHKNHAVLFQALAVLRDEHGRTPHLYLTGAATEFQPHLARLSEQLGIAGQVHWLGFVATSELQCLYASATAMLFPSLFEGFGLPILEAFHSGLPVLASNATVIPEVAQEGAAYFNPDLKEELAALMLRAIDDPAWIQTLRQKGTEVLRRYDMQQTAEALRRLYAQVALPHPPL